MKLWWMWKNGIMTHKYLIHCEDYTFDLFSQSHKTSEGDCWFGCELWVWEALFTLWASLEWTEYMGNYSRRNGIDIAPHIYITSLSSCLTRQNSMQSVGNMPPLPLCHLLPHVLQIMPRNPKYDQFQSKGHHNGENAQSTTKMPGNPKLTHFTKWK